MNDSLFINDVNHETFDSLVIEQSHQTPVLVDFWAGWCNPCKILMPILTDLAQEYNGKFHLVKVDTDVERSLAEHYGVRSLPTVKVFRFGEIVDEFSGVIPESDIRALIEKYIERESDGLYKEAKQALENGDIIKAKSTMLKAMAGDPDRKIILLGMTEVYLAEGSLVDAEELLHKLPMNMQTDDDVENLKARITFAKGVKDAPDLNTLETSIVNDPKDTKSLYQLGCYYAVDNDHKKALEVFLKLLLVDKNYDDGAPRKAMLSIFNILDGGPLVNMYRSKMASALL